VEVETVDVVGSGGVDSVILARIFGRFRIVDEHEEMLDAKNTPVMATRDDPYQPCAALRSASIR
jgi:hypothetical protein